MLKDNKLNPKKVFVGLSGGVDSAVSAYLLKKAGYNIIGVFIKTWQPDFISCTWREDRRDAMRVASHLEIPFITLDLEKEYKEYVVDYMIEEYKKGRTPNPDIMCNREIKFGAFLKYSLNLGADYIATGHYARIVKSGKWKVESKKIQNTSLNTNHYSLTTATDPSKEQSYFLWTLRQEQLAKIIFPIGNLKKSEVRKIAKKAGLPNAEKKDSQGICMLGDISIKEFLSHYIPEKKGSVLNTKGEVVGEHSGVTYLTIGERHGFTITKKTPEDPPMYIIAKDLNQNTITVGIEADLNTDEKLKKEFILENTNWITSEPKEGKIYDTQIRYHQDIQKATLEKKDDIWQVNFDTPQTGASGQSVVVYEGDVCLGGGVIK